MVSDMCRKAEAIEGTPREGGEHTESANSKPDAVPEPGPPQTKAVGCRDADKEEAEDDSRGQRRHVFPEVVAVLVGLEARVGHGRLNVCGADNRPETAGCLGRKSLGVGRRAGVWEQQDVLGAGVFGSSVEGR